MTSLLTVVTASHRNWRGLASLATEILPWLDSGLRWVIKDSGACEETLRWAASALAHEPRVIFDAASDRGIYDALNQALGHVSSEYYLVVGSDDRVDGTALARVVGELRDRATNADVLTFPVRTFRGLWGRKRFRPLWVSSSRLFTSHSVGTLIRANLHQRIGLYDTTYRILADSLFLRKAWMAGAHFEHRSGPILGQFGLEGVSSREHGRRIVETYSYMVAVGSPRWLQAALFALRLLRYRPVSLL